DVLVGECLGLGVLVGPEDGARDEHRDHGGNDRKEGVRHAGIRAVCLGIVKGALPLRPPRTSRSLRQNANEPRAAPQRFGGCRMELSYIVVAIFVLVAVVFLFVIVAFLSMAGVFVFFVNRVARQGAEDNRKPVLSEPARVVAKRTDTSGSVSSSFG